jgi:phenylalanyl-tRNA synthetase beta subunit
MKVSYSWLQTYFEKPIPKPDVVRDLLTAHAFEVESVEEHGPSTRASTELSRMSSGQAKDFILDVKVMPDRAHDCLSHLGIAKEISTLSGVLLKKEWKHLKELSVPESNVLRVEIEDPKICKRFSALVIENVEVKESPAWLKNFLETIGQRSINNVVDATNFVMFSIGQPLHAYDRALLKDENGSYKITARLAKEGEKVSALDKKEHILTSADLLITDGNSGVALGIAAIKGGVATKITEHTKDIVIESANFDAVSIRKTSKRLGLRTDASVRFENEITPELTTQALSLVADIIFDIAKTDSTRVEGLSDVYPRKANPYKVGVSISEVKSCLGIDISKDDIEAIFERSNFVFEKIQNPREHFLKVALSLVGTKYKMGASVSSDAPREFDCAGLIAFSAMHAGVQIPRMSVDQYVFCSKVDEDDVQEGDLIFAVTEGADIHTESKEWMMGTPVPEGINHVGIMVSKKEVFHTSRYNPDGARKESLENFLEKREFRGYGRVPTLGDESRFVVTISAERLDLRMKEDLIEEIGRIYGYENISPKPIKAFANNVEINKSEYYTNIVSNALVNAGFSEVFTYAFQDSGEVELENPIAGDKGYLRKSLVYGLQKSLEMNFLNADLLGLEQIKIFEIGKVFEKDKEYTSLGLAVKNAKGYKGKKEDEEVVDTAKILSDALGGKLNMVKEGNVYHIDLDQVITGLSTQTEPSKYHHDDSQLRYKKISAYPFVLRDIAVFVPTGVSAGQLLDEIKKEAGELLVNSTLFDEFKKGDQVSFAYRLVFLSQEKTLTDDEVNKVMERVVNEITKNNWQVR